MASNSEMVWLALDSSGPGGIESHVRQVVRGLGARGVSVRVVFLRDHGPHPLRDELDELGVPVSVLDGRPSALFRALRASRPGVLHTHGYKAGMLGRLSARLLGVPVVSTYHAGEPGAGAVRLYDILDRASARLCDALIAVSEAIAARIPGEVEVFDNFVDVPPESTTRGSAVAFVGRLSEEKGPDRIAALAAAAPQVRFVVFGDGPMRASIEATLPANVELRGAVASMDPYWSEVGLLIMPSRHEGLPMAALEAMARGIPVAASAVGALPELLAEGGGWCEPEGDTEALGRRVARWAALDDEGRSEAGHKARARVVERYSTDAAIPRLLGVYRRAMQRYGESRMGEAEALKSAEGAKR